MPSRRPALRGVGWTSEGLPTQKLEYPKLDAFHKKSMKTQKGPTNPNIPIKYITPLDIPYRPSYYDQTVTYNI